MWHAISASCYMVADFLFCLIFAGNYSLQVAINWSKRHPLLPSRPVIYWDVILLLLPAELGGADVGVVLGYVFPDTLLIVFAILILLFTSAVTAMKGWQYYKKESVITNTNLSTFHINH